jgi:hypothetical protein
MLSALFFRRSVQPPAPHDIDTLRLGPRSMRLEVCPPAAGRRPWLAALNDWLGQGWPSVDTRPWQPPGVARRSGTLPMAQIKQEFADSVCDLGTPQGSELLDRIHYARSMHELWHLRADIFSQVSVHHSQEEAQERLAWLNRHFPTRSPRSGFGALTPKDMWP